VVHQINLFTSLEIEIPGIDEHEFVKIWPINSSDKEWIIILTN